VQLQRDGVDLFYAHDFAGNHIVRTNVARGFDLAIALSAFLLSMSRNNTIMFSRVITTTMGLEALQGTARTVSEKVIKMSSSMFLP